jgi:pilus assembly protein CpaF
MRQSWGRTGFMSYFLPYPEKSFWSRFGAFPENGRTKDAGPGNPAMKCSQMPRAKGNPSSFVVLLCGATGSGKTTLLGDLLAEVPAGERILAIEDTPELNPDHPHFLSLYSRPANADGFGEVTLRALLRQTLRMRPDRIVLGECRGPEVLELLQALNTGHRGAMATLHANSCRDALRRVELLCLLASSGSIPQSAIRELLGSGISWVAHVSREEGQRRIDEICRVEGREGDTLLLRPMVKLGRCNPPHSVAMSGS